MQTLHLFQKHFCSLPPRITLLTGIGIFKWRIMNLCSLPPSIHAGPSLSHPEPLYPSVFIAPRKLAIFNPMTVSHRPLPSSASPPEGFSHIECPLMPGTTQKHGEIKSHGRQTLINKDSSSLVTSTYLADCWWATPKIPQASSGITHRTELSGPQQRLTQLCASLLILK